MSGQFPDLDQHVPQLSAAALKERLDAGESITLLDTRRPSDFATWQIEHPNLEAINVPFTAFLDDDTPANEVPAGVPNAPLVTCCAKGVSSMYVAAFLARAGWSVEALEDGMRGWARLYRAVDVQERPLVRQYHRPSSGCLSYLVCSDDEAAVIDPLRSFTERYLADVEALGGTLKYAIDTHVHADHVSGIRDLRDRTDATAILPRGAVPRGLAFDATLVTDGETLSLGATIIEALSLPGHTTEMTGFVVAEAVLLGGDSLFLESVARPDLEAATSPEEAASRLYETIQQVAARPGTDRLAPGHVAPVTEPKPNGAYTDTISSLRASHPASSMDRDTFVSHAIEELPPRPNAYKQIIATNLGLETVDREEAFELELGPNDCSAGS